MSPAEPTLLMDTSTAATARELNALVERVEAHLARQSAEERLRRLLDRVSDERLLIVRAPEPVVVPRTLPQPWRRSDIVLGPWVVESTQPIGLRPVFSAPCTRLPPRGRSAPRRWRSRWLSRRP